MAAVAGVSYKMTILPLCRQRQRRLSQQSPDTGHATQTPKVPCKGHRPGWRRKKSRKGKEEKKQPGQPCRAPGADGYAPESLVRSWPPVGSLS